MNPSALRPSEASALIIGVSLPTGLEALRQRHVADAASGLPAHVTMAYPFARPDSIDDDVLALVGEVVGRHAPWTMRLVEGRRWPSTVYVAVEPEAPAIALQADLAAAFPSLPIYGGAIDVFVPHVTIAEGPGADDPALDDDPSWDDLPVTLDVRCGGADRAVGGGAMGRRAAVPDAGLRPLAQARRSAPWRSRRTSITDAGSSPRSARSTSAWYSRSPASPASSARVPSRG